MNEGDASLFDWEYLCVCRKRDRRQCDQRCRVWCSYPRQIGYCFVVEQLKEATVKL